MARPGHIVSRTLLGVLEDPAAWHPRCQELHRCWQSLPRAGHLPSRKDFDPLAVPGLLRDLFLIDVVRDDAGARRYRYRLVGTGNVERFGRDNTGRWLDEAIEVPHRDNFLDMYERAVTTRAPICEKLTAEHMQRKYLLYERLLLPMADDGETPDILVGLICETGS